MLRATWHPTASSDPSRGRNMAAMKNRGFEILTGQEADAVTREPLAGPGADQPDRRTNHGLRWWLEQRLSKWSRIKRPAMHSHWSW